MTLYTIHLDNNRFTVKYSPEGGKVVVVVAPFKEGVRLTTQIETLKRKARGL